MRAAIYGAGAMGTVLGALITKNGGDIELITRNKEHVEALKERGAHIKGEADFTVKVKAALPDEMSGKYDIVFLMTKQRATAEACKHILNFLADDGVVCTVQNGIPEPAVAEIVGKEKCLGAVASWGASKAEHGEAMLNTKIEDMQFSLGSYYGGTHKMEEVAKVLSLAGKVKSEDNFVGARWAKLSINSAFSAVSALTGMTFGEIAKDSKTGAVALKLMNEAFDVAEKYGVQTAFIRGHDIMKYLRGGTTFKNFKAKVLLPFAMKRHAKIVSGMYYDLTAGNKCDVEYINGVISHLGKKLGVKTPYNDRVVKLCHEAEKRIASGEPAQNVITRKNVALICQ